MTIYDDILGGHVGRHTENPFGKLYAPEDSRYTDDEIKKRFPKRKRKQYLNYILLVEKDEIQRAQLIYLYTIDIVKKRWKEAEPHLKKNDTVWSCYETRILKTWKRYKPW